MSARVVPWLLAATLAGAATGAVGMASYVATPAAPAVQAPAELGRKTPVAVPVAAPVAPTTSYLAVLDDRTGVASDSTLMAMGQMACTDVRREGRSPAYAGLDVLATDMVSPREAAEVVNAALAHLCPTRTG